MKFSEMWLREWINPPINNIQLIDQLTMIGLQVDKSKTISNIFHGTIIGEIIEYKIHPNLNKKWIVTVNNGSKKLLNIVCDAINYKKNLRVVVASSGTLLPNGQTVQYKKIQGEISEGILCSFSMLGLAFIDNTTNIIELPIDAPIGQEFYEYWHLNDNIIDISITPNRGDCLSILGIAREIAVINHMQLKTITTKPITPTIHETISVKIEDPIACPKFLGRIIKNININVATPLWIKEKLRRCGIISTNIVTDITNYVLLELGHPIHVFDYKKIDNNTIYVRFAKTGEILKLPHRSINIELSSNTLITADDNKPLSIAGIITDNRSDISPDTCDIVLQSAFFNPSIIIGQSKLYNTQTLSSLRYERGVDPSISKLALNHVTSLLLQTCGGYSGPIINITSQHNKLLQPNVLILKRITLNKVLGFHISDLNITNILHNLGFSIKTYKNAWEITTPTWRFDISIEENIISEIARIYGYNNIPITNPIYTNFVESSSNKTSTITSPSLSRVKNLLVDRGYHEAITYSLVDPNIQKLLYPKQNILTILNPIKPEMSVMRISLWIGLIEALIFNQNRQQTNIQLFETGICFTPVNITKHQINQNFMIAGIRSGSKFNENWDLKECPVDFYDIKGDVESLISITKNLNHITFKKHTHPALHPGQSSAIYLNNICIGYMGLIHPTIQMQLNIRTQLLVFELSWTTISKNIPKLTKYTNISKFPKNCSDISIIVPNHITSESIINTCKKTIQNLLVDIKLSDVYIGNNIPNGFKSLTIKLFLQSTTHTLQEQEISHALNQCLTTLKNIHHATIR